METTVPLAQGDSGARHQKKKKNFQTPSRLLPSPHTKGQTTVNSLYGTRVAVLAGDFLFAQSSWFLANLDNLEVIKLISQVCSFFEFFFLRRLPRPFELSIGRQSGRVQKDLGSLVRARGGLQRLETPQKTHPHP